MKLVPGMNKRGKGEVVVCVCGDSDVCVSLAAARAALHRFIQSRDSSQRERDLLKSVKVCWFCCEFSLLLSLYRTMICLGISHTNSQISSARARFDRRASSQAHAHVGSLIR